jgi:hypothetical protein
VIWVEILGRHGEVVARHRCDGAEARIGRGYDNDVVVDDPMVAARHLVVRRGEDGRLVAEDQGSASGIFVGEAGPQQRVTVDGDQPLRIGRTLVRIREPGHPVAPERKAAPVVHAWPRVLALAAAVIALETFLAWLGDTSERKVARYALPIGIHAALTLAWTSAWAVLTRIFAGQARFDRHLIIALTGLLAFSIADEIVDAAAFAFSWRLLADLTYVAAWVFLAGLCWLHLREIGHAHLKLKAAVVFGLAAAAVGAQTLAQAELRQWTPRQSYLRDLKPPFMRIASPQDGAAFFDDAAKLKAKLDRARKEEKPAGGLPGIDDDE